MVRWTHLLALSLLFCGETARAVETYDLIPADALGGVACRSIQGLVKKSDKLAKDVGLELKDSPADLCKLLFTSIGIKAGLDTQGGCSLVAVNEKHVGAKFNLGIRGGGNAEQFVVFTIPF